MSTGKAPVQLDHGEMSAPVEVMSTSEGDPLAPTQRVRADTIKVPGIGRFGGSSPGPAVMRCDSGVSRLRLHSLSTMGIDGEQTKQKSRPRLILKMTSFTEDDEQTSFAVYPPECLIGRASSNALRVPTDPSMSSVDHARIVHCEGKFFLIDSKKPAGTYIRLSPEDQQQNRRTWPLHDGSIFKAGSSEFQIKEYPERASIDIRAISGRLTGATYTLDVRGATLGRSADNSIHSGDSELSRRHAVIEYEETDNKFYLVDVGSTNGTFMRLTGKYGFPYHICAGDQILIAQTCFSVNRFDFGAYSEIGYRHSMEDVHTVVQDMGIQSLHRIGLSPQSFFAVFDGHGGCQAAEFAGSHLHVAVGEQLDRSFSSITTDIPPTEVIEEVISKALYSAFAQVDRTFLERSELPDAGCTATVALVLGRRIVVANVGDSRTVLCRGGTAITMTKDHKPTRPDETQRIRDAGGFVINGRVMGELAVSRALGDAKFKETGSGTEPLKILQILHKLVGNGQPLVSSVPEIQIETLRDEDEFLLLACDGLFDVFEDQEAVDFITTELKQDGDVQRACEVLADVAINERGSTDNVTILVVLLAENGKEVSKN